MLETEQYEVILLLPHSYLGISAERMKGLKLLGGSFWCEFVSVLPQMCDTFLIGMSRKGRSHEMCQYSPLFAERKGAERYSVRNCFIFWLMSESFIITALIRLITDILINKMLPETALRAQRPLSQSTQITLSSCCSLLGILLEYTSALRREFWCVKTLLINHTDHDMPLLKALLLGH